MWIGGQNTGKNLRTPPMDGPPPRQPAFSPRRRFRRHFCLADLLFSRPCAVAMERRSPSDSPARARPPAPAHVSPATAVLVLPTIERAGQQSPCFPSEILITRAPIHKKKIFLEKLLEKFLETDFYSETCPNF